MLFGTFHQIRVCGILSYKATDVVLCVVHEKFYVLLWYSQWLRHVGRGVSEYFVIVKILYSWTSLYSGTWFLIEIFRKIFFLNEY